MTMNRTMILSCALALPLMACSAPQYAERSDPVPPAAPRPVEARQSPGYAAPNEAATEAWLTEQIEKAPRVTEPERPELPPLRDPDAEVYWEDDFDDYGYRGPYRREYYAPVYARSRYYDPYGYYGRPYRRSTFPINTAIGAGVGAIIGHQHGRRGRGALIGGGIGLLFDSMR